MSKELKAYNSNLSTFLEKISTSVVKTIECEVDKSPAQFDKTSLSFDFIYCNSISFITSQENFKIITSQTTDGLDTFWVNQENENNKSNYSIEVNSVLKSYEIEEKRGFKFPFKLTIQFQELTLYLYCAEIYETHSSAYDYKINDEMIFVFRSDKEASKFEALLNYR